ncbi:MAG: MotA/TolQ/ExbB proton channel family protein [Verrucomicrobia bacterium]|nr:MotA/TolQ/ExbB proton channel family protein [Verrucomicrobiota bacterium]
MWLLLTVSVLALAIFIERMLFLHRATISVTDLLRGLTNLIRAGRYDEAARECQATPGPVARVLRTAIAHHRAGHAERKEYVEEAAQLEITRLEGFLPLLATIAHVAPLIGLLGTVTGLLSAFSAVNAQGGFANAADLSAGLYSALITSAGGLAIAITAYFAHSYLCSQVNALIHDMERAGTGILHVITEAQTEVAAGDSIISFQAAAASLAAEQQARQIPGEPPVRRDGQAG